MDVSQALPLLLPLRLHDLTPYTLVLPVWSTTFLFAQTRDLEVIIMTPPLPPHPSSSNLYPCHLLNLVYLPFLLSLLPCWRPDPLLPLPRTPREPPAQLLDLSRDLLMRLSFCHQSQLPEPSPIISVLCFEPSRGPVSVVLTFFFTALRPFKTQPLPSFLL